MADVSVKMGVSGIAQFKQGMKDAEASVKTLDAAMQKNEKAFKQTGDAESHLAKQTDLLNQKLQQQKTIVKNAEQALKQMEANGVKTTSAAYQNMQRRLLEAQSGIMDTEQELDNLGAKASGAAVKTDQLSASLGGLNKKISLDQVTRGIESITGGMEKAAKKAADLGKAIWENITDSARWADDAATQAMVLNMDVEEYQRYKKVFDTVGELTVQEWQKAKLKVQKAINDPTQDQTDILALLGIKTHEGYMGKYGWVEDAARNFEDVFWEIGETLREKVASGEMTQDLADTYANALFGKGFAELNPMFALGKTGFSEELEKQIVNTKEEVNALAEYNDKLIKLKGDIETLENKITAGFAPALEKAADALSGLLGNVLDYLETDEGKQALQDLSTAVSGLFDDLGKIDPADVVDGFSKVFNSIVDSVKWLTEHWHEVVDAMTGIVVGWGALKLSGGALQILKLINGLKGLGGGAGAAAAAGEASAGAASGATAGTAETGIVSKALHIAPYAAPFVVAIDQLVHDQQVVNEAMQKGAESIREYQEKSAQYEGSDMFGIWDTLTKYTSVNGSPEDRAAMAEFVKHYWEWWNDEVTDSALDAMVGAMSQEDFDLFHDIMGRMARGEQFYSNEDLAALSDAMAAALKATEQVMAEEPLKIPSEAELPDDVNEILTAEIGKLRIPAEVMILPGGFSLEGPINQDLFAPHANGLPMVPFDGYPALLHKGEQVIPAREVGNRSYSSNMYIESMYMNNGQDAEGLAAAIAAANRRTMRGFGS